MNDKNKKELAVAALENGTVIDHIPSDSLFKVVDLLGIQSLEENVTIGNNLDSKKYGKKGIIKVANVTFPEATLNRIAIAAPNAVINIIKNYEVVEKHKVSLPDDIYGIVKCTNPKCITNNEPMRTHFHVIDRENMVLKCHYCERTENKDKITLK
ncbi:MAG: aspartate carbamoyltransferase regulatory subunit [Muribaculaceae bacterium]|nr:aspartate carbamoyltransferase regulatory subunit [Muribaculaceae bacterium]MEE1297997.1 aspartate carbamoyltransferase regulatory subunit [Muribaculaceae bacterium]